jgi:hypothetical protein
VTPENEMAAVRDMGGMRYEQSEVNYRRGRGPERCGNCVHFEAPSECEIVEPPIEASGLCDEFEDTADQGGGLEQLGPMGGMMGAMGMGGMGPMGRA